MLAVENRLKEVWQTPSQHQLVVDPEEREIRHHMMSCEDPASQARFKAVLLHKKGYSINRIQEETGRGRSSIYKWVSTYKQHGLEGLLDRRRGGNNARLSDKQIRELAERLRSHTPADLLGAKAATPDGRHWTVEDAYNAILEWYGIVFKSRTSYYRLLKMCLPESQPLEVGHNHLQDGRESEAKMYPSAQGRDRNNQKSFSALKT